MNENDPEKLRLQHELDAAKRREEVDWRATRIAIFLCIWLLPLLGMELADYKPKAEIGPLSIWGFWFLFVPFCGWIYLRFAKNGDRS